MPFQHSVYSQVRQYRAYYWWRAGEDMALGGFCIERRFSNRRLERSYAHRRGFETPYERVQRTSEAPPKGSR